MDSTPLLDGGLPSGDTPPAFYRRVYTYWRKGGWICILVSRVCDLVISAFILLLLMFLAGAVDYQAMWYRVEHVDCTDGSRNTAPLYETDCWGVRVIDTADLGRMHPALALVVAFCVVLWVVALGRIVFDMPMLWSVKTFYEAKLKIKTADLNVVPWSEVMNRMALTSTRTELQIIHCITRVDDFDTGLFNDHVLAPFVWVPGLGRVAYLPDDLRWWVHYALQLAIETPTYGDVGETAANLEWRLRMLAAVGLVASPAIIIYRLALYVFRYADEWKRRPSALATRQWSPWARAKLRNYCELPHDVDARLARAEPSTQKFLQYGSSELIAVVARAVVLLCGGILSVNVILAFVYDEEYLTLDLTPGRSVAFWMGVAGVVMAGANALVPSERIEESEHVQHYRTMLKHLQCDVDAKEINTLYQYRAVLAAQVVLSAVLTPVVLMWVVAPQAGEVARYLFENTRMCPLAGPVCRHALFEQESIVGGDKVETSLIEFRKQYKHWRANTEWQASVLESVTLEE